MSLGGAFNTVGTGLPIGLASVVLSVIVMCCPGTNLQSLLDHTQSCESSASIVLVISNVAGVKGLDRAQKAGIETAVSFSCQNFFATVIIEDSETYLS